jgi:signal transduction histidine kinase
LQTLYAVTLTASRALRLLPQRQAIGLETSLEDILRLADAGQCELRTLLMQIRADSRAPGGLTDGLTNLAAEVRTQNDLDIRLSLPEEPRLPAATKAALVSISREALHNVVKHAAATRVDIALERDAGQLLLLIIDDGRGFDPRTCRPGHFGLQSMRERAAAVGGMLAYTSADGAGTQVRVRIPQATGRHG